MLEKENKITIGNIESATIFFGSGDENFRYLRSISGADISARGAEVFIKGKQEEVEFSSELIRNLLDIVETEHRLGINDINYMNNLLRRGEKARYKDIVSGILLNSVSGKAIKAKTLGQKRYIQAILKDDVVFGIGPAGTGKTYLAVVMAVRALRNKEVERIILVRPAVEAGEKLGFLPGDLIEKVNPYLRPLYDSLFDILGVDITQRYLEKNIIEVAPLAYMRGRTLNDAFIILDEAQNTTPQQMKMFLTRLGFGSKAVITGDITQVDLPVDEYSGLIEVQKILSHVKGVSFEYLTKEDVIRHPLVQLIINAYEQHDERISSH
ncbi:MAG: PhoH family protein [Syntrophomonadaceae bacterium]|nr:PhoH family protein [Syntrophomonadaceae bacterium]